MRIVCRGGIQPIAIAVDPRGTRLYMANQTNISVLDAITNTLIANVPLPPGALDPAALVVVK